MEGCWQDHSWRHEEPLWQYRPGEQPPRNSGWQLVGKRQPQGAHIYRLCQTKSRALRKQKQSKAFAFVWPWSHCPICKNHYDFWQQQVVAPTHKSLKGDRLYVLYIDFFAHYMRLITLNHWIFIIRADTLYKDYSWSYHASLRNLDVLGVAPFGGASQHHQTARGAIGWLLNLVLKEAGKPCDETVSASIDLSDFCSSVWEAAVR